MKSNKILLMVVMMGIIFCSCIRPDCPLGYYWDGARRSCTKLPAACPDDSIVDLRQGVRMAIDCVKDDPSKFDLAFAALISIAQKSPDINNGEVILDFIKAVAIDNQYVPSETGKKKWNRYFSPTFFVSAGYLYKNIASYCPNLQEIKKNIDEELGHKEIGLMKCMANQASKDEVLELWRRAQLNATSLKKGLDAACEACCAKKKLM